MEEAKTMKTPMISSIKFYKDEKETYLSTFWIDGRLWIGFLGRLKAKSPLLLGHRASAQLSRLSRRHAKSEEGHRDKVSYYEAFLIDSILTGRRITRVFKDVGVDLSKETDFEGVLFEATFSESTCTMGPSTQQSFTKPSSGLAFIEPPHTKIPPPQAPLAPDHAPWMHLSTQISSLGTWRSLLYRGLSILRIAWISIRLASLHSLSISNR
ncbi:hypothetical protein CK203_049494 [Vitis vinifera]|uniref:Uncharacterized protein n=1 Tax=Vitis vinifera TaxID=29760 RepID=A0A438HBD1_VITVI|nr:hypothetical protein CK203_049494 [Vitis vinifera]